MPAKTLSTHTEIELQPQFNNKAGNFFLSGGTVASLLVMKVINPL